MHGDRYGSIFILLERKPFIQLAFCQVAVGLRVSLYWWQQPFSSFCTVTHAPVVRAHTSGELLQASKKLRLYGSAVGPPKLIFQSLLRIKEA